LRLLPISRMSLWFVSKATRASDVIGGVFESVYMRFENDDVSEFCRAYLPVFIVDVTTAAAAAVDAAPRPGDAGGGGEHVDIG